jgi:parallel beta helix pectate lyase-like protein
MIDLEQAIGATADGGSFVIPATDDGSPYPNTYLRNIVKTQGITVTAEPSVVVQGFVSQDSAGITFDGLTLTVDETQKKAFAVQGGDRLNFHNLKISGKDTLDGSGISLINCTNSSILNCEIQKTNGGIGVSKCSDLVVSDNNIHDIGCDGTQFNATSRVTISGNMFTNFFPAPGDHSDAIQFQGVGQTGPATDITITDNEYIRGDVPVPSAQHPGTQGVFMNDESGFGYENVTIKGNAFLGTVFHGIALSHAQSFEISGNLVVGYTDTLQTDYNGDGKPIDIVPWILTDTKCDNGQVFGNTTTSLNNEAGATVNWHDNISIIPIDPANAATFLADWLSKQAPPEPVAEPQQTAPEPQPEPQPEPAAQPEPEPIVEQPQPVEQPPVPAQPQDEMTATESKLKADIEDVMSKLAAAEARAETAEASLAAAQAATVDPLQAQVDALQAQVNSLTDRATTAENALAASQAALADAQRSLAASDALVAKVRADLA